MRGLKFRDEQQQKLQITHKQPPQPQWIPFEFLQKFVHQSKI